MKEIISKETIKLIENHRLPSYNEIPNVGLYLEQTAKYINEYLEPVMDTAMTGSMISNYVKKKLVSNPVKKLYYRDQIAKLIIIAVLKSVVSLDKVDILLKKDSEGKIEEEYTCFCKAFSVALEKVFGISDEILEDETNILQSVVVTVAHKIHIDKMLSDMANQDND